mmetsp:Transcript_57936/g.161691  ORF Transcript_57936/g.161691 Transcript_57936/m.161691 type:complete len:112 (+) Transcript_57936:180-515(+)
MLLWQWGCAEMEKGAASKRGVASCSSIGCPADSTRYAEAVLRRAALQTIANIGPIRNADVRGARFKSRPTRAPSLSRRLVCPWNRYITLSLKTPRCHLRRLRPCASVGVPS